MRKYTGLMVVVLVLLAAGLILTMKPGGSGGGAGSNFMSVNGQAIDRLAYSKLGGNAISATQLFGQSQNFNDFFKLSEFVRSLSGSALSEEQQRLNFVTNRLLLQQASEKLGLYSSPEVAQQFIQDNMFQGRDGTFDPKAYAEYINTLDRAVGMKEREFEQLVAEYIVFTKVRDLVAGGLELDPKVAIAEDQLARQTIQTSTVDFKILDFAKEIKPSEEEVKAYWETHKDRYKTQRLLKLSYVLTNLSDADEPKRPSPNPEMSPEEVSKQTLEYQTKHAEWTKNRKEHTKVLTKMFSDFIDSVQDSEGQTFDQAATIVKENGGADFQVATTEAFAIDNAPAELSKLTLKDASARAGIIESIFAKKFSDELIYNIDFFQVGRDGNIAIRIDEEIKPAVKSFDDAAELAREDLIQDLANKAMLDHAEAKRSKLVEALGAGKSFADAVAAEGLEAQLQAPLTQESAQQANPGLFRIAQVTTANEIAATLVEASDSAQIVFVADRSLQLTGDEALKESQLLERNATQLKYIAFNAWLIELNETAELTLPRVN
ncbi:SurA N-terminal domain-containing protein [Rubritalea marina]|uniref:SurA N-terminal domain-containing protein n=1 Tax=Rubritalea marina TaxID=361055 RepID=UPI001969D96C|nr:SurA N-terminal domain-containing protein [Rubritalea marina]